MIARGPLGRDAVVHAPDGLVDDDLAPAREARPLPALAGHRARPDDASGGAEISGGQHVGRLVLDRVQLQAEPVGDHLHVLAKQSRQPERVPLGVLPELRRRLTEAHHAEHDLGRRIALEVGNLADVDLLDPLRQRAHRQWQHVAQPAGIEAGRMKRRATAPAGPLQPLIELRAVHLRVHVAHGGDDVLTRRQQRAEVIDVGDQVVAVHQGRQRGVQHHVGVHRHDLIDAVGRGDTQRVDPGERAGVHAGLVGRDGVQPHEFHVAAPGDRA